MAFGAFHQTKQPSFASMAPNPSVKMSFSSPPPPRQSSFQLSGTLSPLSLSTHSPSQPNSHPLSPSCSSSSSSSLPPCYFGPPFSSQSHPRKRRTRNLRQQLLFRGFYAPTGPERRIRVYQKLYLVESYQNASQVFFDCICGQMSPGKSLDAALAHVRRHESDESLLASYENCISQRLHGLMSEEEYLLTTNAVFHYEDPNMFYQRYLELKKSVQALHGKEREQLCSKPKRRKVSAENTSRECTSATTVNFTGLQNSDHAMKHSTSVSPSTSSHTTVRRTSVSSWNIEKQSSTAAALLAFANATDVGGVDAQPSSCSASSSSNDELDFLSDVTPPLSPSPDLFSDF